jgi:hypothetical protein
MALAVNNLALPNNFHPDCPECRASLNSASYQPPVPDFAQVNPQHLKPVDPKLHQEELRQTIVLYREHVFLCFHWLLFITINLIGLFMAFKCYIEYIGDSMTRLMIATTPLIFINTTAFTCWICIDGTNKKIKRIKEELHHVKLQIEYEHLI